VSFTACSCGVLFSEADGCLPSGSGDLAAANISHYMLQVSTSAYFDANSTIEFRLPSQNSAPSVSVKLGLTQLPFLQCNSSIKVYIRANCSNGFTESNFSAVKVTLVSCKQPCIPLSNLTTTPLPEHICTCYEALWREHHDPNSPRPTMVEMGVQLPYAIQSFNAALNESFKRSVAETAEVEIFRVEIKSVTAMQISLESAINVSFSIRAPQDLFYEGTARVNFPRHGKTEKMRAALNSTTGHLSLNTRLRANGVKAFSQVYKEAVVVPPDLVMSFCIPPAE
jgi:hypothetical protein